MKRKIVTGIIILVCFLLESTIFHKLTFASISPNLMIIIVSSFGFMRGKKTGMTVGFTCGLFVDVFWGNMLGFHMLIYTFIAGIVFGSKTNYFPIFVFAGLSIWNFFNKTVSASVKIVSKNRDIVTKVYVPKFVLLLVRLFVNLFKMIVTFGLLIIFMIFFKVPLSWNVLWVIPVIICSIIITFGVSSIFMHFGVFIDDLVNLTAIGLKFMFYLSGIF